MSIIHYEFTNTTTYNTPLSGRNLKFKEYIDKYNAAEGIKDMDTLLKDETDSVILQNLSELRGGLVSFYDFRKGASVLEIGASFGALTDRLLDKCEHVTVTEKSVFRAQMIESRFEHHVKTSNLDIYVGDVLDMTFDVKFDYVILTGLLEKIGNGTVDPVVYADYLSHLRSLLTEDGVLLLAVDNRFGLKYLAGGVDPYTNKAFSGVNGYTEGTKGRTFTRAELEKIISLSGFNNKKFYYPLPDYKFPQLIYTDEYLPEANVRERLIPYYFRKDTLVFDELSAYYDLVTNGGFPFAANSFLIECTNDKESLCDINYAAISTDRGKELSYITAIHANDTVTKVPIYKGNKHTITTLIANTEDLNAHGIPVVTYKISNDELPRVNDESGDDAETNALSLTMPYIRFKTLSNYIKDVIATDSDKVLKILDDIYEFILKSSEITGEGEDGPILKKAYMELIPLNCFYDSENSKYLFFDQEFYVDNCPAKYVLFRAIHYIYCFTPNAEKYIALSSLKEKYGLVNTWDKYLTMEREFLDRVRNHEKYAWFYKYAYADKNRIKDNANRLASEAEKKNEYHISDKMKKTWKVELNMLDEIDRICKKYQIQYFMVHGTLLGAVRHKGFIPWDDDLDIAMKRADYDRFIEVVSKELVSPLILQLPSDDSDIWWGAYARIMNVETTAILPHNLEKKGPQGIWIDILPIDVCVEDEKLFNKKLKRLEHIHRLMNAKIWGKSSKYIAGMKLLPSAWYKFLALFKTRKNIAFELDKAMRLYTDTKSKDVAIFTGYQKLKIFNASDFENAVDLEFEGRKLPAPVGYEDYLFRSLGGDYMKFPPEEERKPKHRGIFDPFKPYTEYTELLADTFEGAKDKKIILFGSGLMFEDYMKKYGDKYRPYFIVDNDENKWERKRMGIEIKNPTEILSVPENKRFVIICSYYYKEIIPQLEKMGVTNYKVYVQEMDWILKSEEEHGEKHI